MREDAMTTNEGSSGGAADKGTTNDGAMNEGRASHRPPGSAQPEEVALTVERLMTRVVFVVSPEHSIEVAEATMRQADVRHLAVVDDAGALCAMLSDKDMKLAAPDARVAQVMSRDPVTVSLKAPAYEAVALMLQHRFNGLPVVDDDGALAGIITTTDVMILAYDTLAKAAERPGRSHPRQIEEELLATRVTRLKAAQHPAAAAVATAELETFLVQHFAREEQIGGIFDQLVEEQPERGVAIAMLRRGHTEILGLAQRLLEENRRRAEEGRSTLAPGADELADAIARHEAEEAAVLDRALASP